MTSKPQTQKITSQNQSEKITDKLDSQIEENIKAITNLQTTALKLLRLTLPIMKDLNALNSDIVAEVLWRTKLDKTNEEKITKFLQDKCLIIIDEAEKINKETQPFIESIKLNNDELEQNRDKYPFLLELWSGDMYDGEDGISALNKMNDELLELIKKANTDSLTKEATNYFKPSKK